MSLASQISALATRIGVEVKAVRAELAAQYPQWIARGQKLTSSTQVLNSVILSVQIPSPVVGGVYRILGKCSPSNATAATNCSIGLIVATTAAGSTGTLVDNTRLDFPASNTRVACPLLGIYTHASGAAYANMVVTATSGGTLTDQGVLSPITITVERIA